MSFGTMKYLSILSRMLQKTRAFRQWMNGALAMTEVLSSKLRPLGRCSLLLLILFISCRDEVPFLAKTLLNNDNGSLISRSELNTLFQKLKTAYFEKHNIDLAFEKGYENTILSSQEHRNQAYDLLLELETLSKELENEIIFNEIVQALLDQATLQPDASVSSNTEADREIITRRDSSEESREEPEKHPGGNKAVITIGSLARTQYLPAYKFDLRFSENDIAIFLKGIRGLCSAFEFQVVHFESFVPNMDWDKIKTFILKNDEYNINLYFETVSPREYQYFTNGIYLRVNAAASAINANSKLNGDEFMKLFEYHIKIFELNFDLMFRERKTSFSSSISVLDTINKLEALLDQFQDVDKKDLITRFLDDKFPAEKIRFHFTDSTESCFSRSSGDRRDNIYYLNAKKIDLEKIPNAFDTLPTCKEAVPHR